VLQPAVDDNNQFQPSPVIGYVSTLDTAKLSEYLNNPDVRSVFPKDVDFLYSAKSFGDKQKFYTVYAIKRSTNDGSAPLDGSVVTQARQGL
jgi:SecD/SecF fusion protein